ncbi:hypothetical protein ABIE88_003358 [Bradyrhizobium diazoefficiens]|uniref:hypothetical protein n=1 Tax=Bradyrhizobium diazoefficiens TaxID=1355477 RepID=UPI0035144350
MKKMSPAQVRFMQENANAYFNWLKATGDAIGVKLQPWQKRVIDAMVRRGYLTEEGHITDAGEAAYKKATETAVAVAKRNGAKIHPRVAEIKGNTASLLIIDGV